MLMAQIQFRPDEQLTAELQARAGETMAPSPGLVAQRDLGRYYALLKRSLPTFSLEDAMVLVNALNGLITMPETAHLLWAQVEDFLIDSGVDSAPMPLVERLRKLTPFEALAVADAVERAWNSETYRIDNMEERIRKVGLVKE